MDERLAAGRLHLSNGEEAVRQGYPDDGRMYFEAALLQFRGPEFRLGEAHALRGMAQVAMVNGDAGEAERYGRSAVRGYRELHQQLERIDPTGVSDAMKKQARMGEAASLVLLGETLVRRGAREDARTALSHARVLGAKLGHFDAVAGVWNMLARLAMREGRYSEARDSMGRALATYRENRSVDGQVSTLLLIAEVERLQGNFSDARAALESAKPKAAKSKNPMYEGRVLAASGALALQAQDQRAAQAYYVLALPLVRAAGDQEMEGYALLGLGEIASRRGQPEALEYLTEGARVLADLDHRHGLGGAMLRISEHALRVESPELALAAAECARRLYRKTDPIRGVGQSGRLLVKALAALKDWRAVIFVAAWRVDVVGEGQPTARGVLDFYRERAPAGWWKTIGAMSVGARRKAAVKAIDYALIPILDAVGASAIAWENGQSAVEAIIALSTGLRVDTEDFPPDDDTETYNRKELETDADSSDDAVLVLEDEEPSDMIWHRAPSEFDKVRTDDSLPPTPGPPDEYADLDRYLVESDAPASFEVDDDVLVIELDSAQGVAQ